MYFEIYYVYLLVYDDIPKVEFEIPYNILQLGLIGDSGTHARTNLCYEVSVIIYIYIYIFVFCFCFFQRWLVGWLVGWLVSLDNSSSMCTAMLPLFIQIFGMRWCQITKFLLLFFRLNRLIN